MYGIETNVLGLSSLRDVVCDMFCMLGGADVGGRLGCIIEIGYKMDVRWSKRYDIPTSKSSHLPPITNYNFTPGVC